MTNWTVAMLGIACALAGCAKTMTTPPRAWEPTLGVQSERAIEEPPELTSAVVPAAPARGWTDPQILAIVTAASSADLEEAQVALDRARDRFVVRFAHHLEMDDATLGARARTLAARIGTEDSAERLEVDVERTGYLLTIRGALPNEVDASFLKAQAKQCTSLLHLIDDRLYAAAESPEVRALLAEIRAGALEHYAMAQGALAREASRGQ